MTAGYPPFPGHVAGRLLLYPINSFVGVELRGKEKVFIWPFLIFSSIAFLEQFMEMNSFVYFRVVLE